MSSKLNNPPLNPSRVKGHEALLPVAILAVLTTMLVPLPTIVLDFLLALNLAATVMLLLITLGTRKALDLSVFPSLLLLLTLFRLSLNVATTRLILLDGDAGRIVSAFGGFVVGGQLVVGLVVFMILVVIQFMVITKGAGRISEVAARFTLDALPGKQMAIDAELNSGGIDERQAKQRRVDLARETEFYGSMDGASKFVRGDAIAGLIITAVNLVGGVLIGAMNGLPLIRALNTYAILTIGDGLITQIPALIIATSAALLTTKTSSGTTLDDEIVGQLFPNDRTLWLSSAMVGAFALVPGLPKLPFLSIAGCLLLLRRGQSASERPADGAENSTDSREKAANEADVNADQLDEFLMPDRAVVEVGPKLVPLIESKRMKGLADRIATLRRDLSRTEGIWVPQIRIRSNLHLDAEEYRVIISGRRVAAAVLRTNLLLAIPPDGKPVNLPGEATREPAFNLNAVWISAEQKTVAAHQGYTVVDPLNVLITHLGECLKRYSHELLTRESLRQMLDRVREFAPTVVDDLRPDVIRMGTLHQVLLQLAEDRFPLADLALILETIVYHAPGTKTAEEIVDKVRATLGRLVCDRYRDPAGNVRVVALEPKLESQLREYVTDGQLGLAPTPLQALLTQVGDSYLNSQRKQQPLALLCDTQLRRPLRKILARSSPELGVIAFQELPPDLMIEPLRILRHDEVFTEPPRTRETVLAKEPAYARRSAPTAA